MIIPTARMATDTRIHVQPVELPFLLPIEPEPKLKSPLDGRLVELPEMPGLAEPSDLSDVLVPSEFSELSELPED